MTSVFFFFQAEDGIRDLVRSRGLGDVYKRQTLLRVSGLLPKSLDIGPLLQEAKQQLHGEADYLLSLIHI